MDNDATPEATSPHGMKVRTVNNKRAYLQIAEQIMELIQQGNLTVGKRLPSEREMAELFSASRPTVREAMSALELAGVVEVRVGRGVYVLGSSTWPAHLLATLEAEAAPSDLLETREALEPHAARLAAERATEEDLEAMAGALEGCYRAVKDQRPDEFEKYDDLFHAAVNAAAHNPILTQISHEISAMRAGKLWTLMKRRAADQATDHFLAYASEHERIGDAIRHGRADQAREAAQVHLDSVRRLLLEDTEKDMIRDLDRRK